MRSVRTVWLLLALVGVAPMASAGLTQQQLEAIGYDRKIGVALPSDVRLVDTGGSVWTTGALFGPKPTFLVFADYTCTTLCGVAVNALASGLADVPYRAGSDYRVVVVGLDPKDGLHEAAAFRDRSVDAAFASTARFMTGSPSAVTTLISAAGLRIAYDAEHDQFAHPAVAIVISGAARIIRYLDPLGMTPFDLRLSLTEASPGQLGGSAEHLFLLCYGWDAATGIYTLMVYRLLAAACGLTLAAIAFTLFFLSRRETSLLRNQEARRDRL